MVENLAPLLIPRSQAIAHNSCNIPKGKLIHLVESEVKIQPNCGYRTQSM